MLSAGRASRPTLVAAHLTYLHLAAYPGSLDLSRAELARIALAPAGLVRDRSLDWQDVELPTDPLPLHSWKLSHLREVIASELRASEYLVMGGRLIVFSDHGNRTGLTPATFSNPRYHHVLLATFGLPTSKPAEPISVIDIGYHLGFSNAPAEPSVEFALAEPADWPALVRTAKPRWSGVVDLDAGLLARIFAGLRRHLPWQAEDAAVSSIEEVSGPSFARSQ
jgi:hypothetical protein